MKRHENQREKELAPMTVGEFILARKRSDRIQVEHHPASPEIVYDIPAPVEARGGLRKFDHYYPFEEMKPGASFWVPSETGCTPGAVTKFAKRTGWKFATRAQAKDGRANNKVGSKERGTRVWRLK